MKSHHSSPVLLLTAAQVPSAHFFSSLLFISHGPLTHWRYPLLIPGHFGIHIDYSSNILALCLWTPLCQFDFHSSQWLPLLKGLSQSLSLSIPTISIPSIPLSELHLFPAHFFSTPRPMIFLSHGYFQFTEHPSLFNVSHLHDLLSPPLTWIKFYSWSF